MTEHELFTSAFGERLLRLTEADIGDLAKFMNIADGDPATFWLGADFTDVDLGEIDVSGWNFSGADLTNADMSKVKNVTKAVFSETTTFDGVKLPEGVTVADLFFELSP